MLVASLGDASKVTDMIQPSNDARATAIAVVMLTGSFVLLLLINVLQGWSTRRISQ